MPRRVTFTSRIKSWARGRPTLFVSTWFSHVEARWDFPGFAHYLRRLGIVQSRDLVRQVGDRSLDPVPVDRLPLLEEWMTDVRAVMDAVGVERAVLLGANEGSLMAALFAATYLDRVSSLVLANATARPAWAPDNPSGVGSWRSSTLSTTASMRPGARG